MTQRLTIHDIEIAAEILRSGGTVAFPTETVYGIGADATNSKAIDAIFKAKGRPSDNPLIIHLFDQNQLTDYCHSISDLAYQLLAAFSPGPLTIVLPKKSNIIDSVTAGLSTVAVRFPDHPIARKILESSNLPIAAPSANLSGKPSATTWQAVLEDLEGRIGAVVCGEPVASTMTETKWGLESTVVDVTRTPAIVLRQGAITLEDLQSIDPTIQLLNTKIFDEVNSPGLRHKHYQPNARVVLIEISEFDSIDTIKQNAAFIGVNSPNDVTLLKQIKICYSINDYAASIYDFFRHCDRSGIDLIYCEQPEEQGIGRAIIDRLRRASS